MLWYYYLAKPKLCPEIPSKGKLIVKGSGVNPGSKRTFSCSSAKHWEISGAQGVTCLDNGQWSALLPTCKLKGEKEHNICSYIFGCNYSYDFSVECGRIEVAISTSAACEKSWFKLMCHLRPDFLEIAYEHSVLQSRSAGDQSPNILFRQWLNLHWLATGGRRL